MSVVACLIIFKRESIYFLIEKKDLAEGFVQFRRVYRFESEDKES